MIFPAIKSITVLCKDGSYIAYNHNFNGVTEIIDKSLEFPNELHNIFYVMKGDSVFVEIVNAPVIIERFN